MVLFFVPPVPLYTIVSIPSTIVEHGPECRRDQLTQSSFAFIPFSKSWRCTTPRPASALVKTVAYWRQNVLLRTAFSRAPLPGVDARYLLVKASHFSSELAYSFHFSFVIVLRAQMAWWIMSPALALLVGR